MNDNTLVIISAQANTSGVYTCLAQNEVGEDKQQIYVEVHGGPHLLKKTMHHYVVGQLQKI